MRFIRTNSILNWLYGEAISYPTPTSLSFFWSFGVMALVCLISQIASGIFLAMHYIPSAELAFSSVEHIMRDVRGGWFLRYLHANGASMFFLVVYLHICRGLYYNSFAGKWQFVWYTGIIILFIMILTAFLGYVLPWGQMSFWAATVITSLASAIPLVGDFVVSWLWGGFSVGEQTLVRFFSLHYLLPFVLFALVAAHIILLHETGSNTPTGVSLNWGDWITFGPYFFLKDLYYLVLFFIVFMYFVFFNPNYLGHPDNYIPAMYMSTPAHIVPEWYFLPFYALLRSVPNKLGGVVVMLLSIVALALLPVILNTSAKKFILNSNFVPTRAIFFSFFVANSLLLGWIGGQPIEEPMYTVGQYSSFFYFFLIFLIFPILNKLLATKLNHPSEISHVWWEDIYSIFKQYNVISLLLVFKWMKKNAKMRARWFEEDAYFYAEGVHWECPLDEMPYIEWDKNYTDFEPEVLAERSKYFIIQDRIFDQRYYKKKLEDLELIQKSLKATPKSEQERIERENRLKSNTAMFFPRVIPQSIKDFYEFLIPSSNIKNIIFEGVDPINFESNVSEFNSSDFLLSFSKNELDWKLAMLTRHESNMYTDSKEWSDVYFQILGREGLNRYENSSEWEETIINLSKSTNESNDINSRLIKINFEDFDQNSLFGKKENFYSKEYIPGWTYSLFNINKTDFY